MGNAALVPLKPDEDAPDGSGKCILSDPFKDLGLADNWEDFAKELLLNVKNKTPEYFQALQDGSFKKLDIDEKSTDNGEEFTVKVILDGEKVADALPPDAKGKDWIRKDTDSVFNKKDRTITSFHYNEPAGRAIDAERALSYKAVTKFLDPLQIVFYIELPDGSRKTDQGMADMLQPVLHPIAYKLKDRKVKIIVAPGKDAFVPTGPMDEVITYDNFMTYGAGAMKTVMSNMIPGIEVISEEEVGEGGVFMQFKSTAIGDGGTKFIRIIPDKAADTIVMESNAGKENRNMVFKVAKDPLTFEAYLSKDGEKVPLASLNEMDKDYSLMIFQETVEETVRKSGSWFW